MRQYRGQASAGRPASTERELILPAPLSARPAWARWALLLVATIAVTAAFAAMRLSAALFIGPMAAAIGLAMFNAGVRVPQIAFIAAQAIVGCMIARTMRASILNEIAHDWPIFSLAVISVIAAACALGYLLARWRVLPGTTAVWGSFPGAATAMTLVAEAYGADIRLVAFMQYLRVVMVALVASGVARLFDASGAAPAAATFPPVDLPAFAATLALAATSVLVGRLLRVPAGALIVPMLLGAVLQNLGVMKIELPPALLAVAYAVIGWNIGLRFTREILVHVAHALPRVAVAILTLIAGCGLFAVALIAWGGVDPLTAYLAMSPGGADSVAIIAASSHTVDVPFVMALQMLRFLVVLVAGPSLARFIADRAERPDRS